MAKLNEGEAEQRAEKQPPDVMRGFIVQQEFSNPHPFPPTTFLSLSLFYYCF
jgi:hypothetical protein